MQGLMMKWQLTLDKIIEHANRLYPHKRVTTMQPDGSLHRMAYGEMYGRVKRLAKALVQRYVDADLAMLDRGLAAAAAASDPVDRALAFLRFYEEWAEELVSEDTACLYITVLSEHDLLDPETRGDIDRAVRGWRVAFAVFGSVGVVWAVAWWRWFRDDPADHPGVNAAELRVIVEHRGPIPHFEAVPWMLVVRNRTLLALCLMYAEGIYGWYFYLTWLPTYLLRARGFDLTHVGWLPHRRTVRRDCGTANPATLSRSSITPTPCAGLSLAGMGDS